MSALSAAQVRIAQAVTRGTVRTDEPMARHTTFAIGGPADVYIEPADEDELVDVLRAVHAAGEPLTVLGGGSNVLVGDGGIRGVTICLRRLAQPLAVSGTVMCAGGGIRMQRVSTLAARQGLSGLEFAVGIPGTLGGGVWMNAGAYGGEMSTVVTEVTAVTRTGERVSYSGRELAFGYRHSVFQDTGDLVTSVTMALVPDDVAAIRARMDDYTARRRHKQPLEYPSAGSTFKRPPGYFAGTLIDETGLKGLTVGGAQISTRHAGFVINHHGATAADVKALIALVQEKIMAAHGVYLEPEVRMIGDD